jgi:hypothetical protein
MATKKDKMADSEKIGHKDKKDMKKEMPKKDMKKDMKKK